MGTARDFGGQGMPWWSTVDAKWPSACMELDLTGSKQLTVVLRLYNSSGDGPAPCTQAATGEDIP